MRPSSTRFWPPTRPSSTRARRPAISTAACPSRSWPNAAAKPALWPMKPVGLTNAHQPDVKPYAVVQLRRDNKLGTLYNIVGFQTKMKYGAQTAVFKMIPGAGECQLRPPWRHPPQHLHQLAHAAGRPDAAEVAPAYPLCGQITGVEGYVESAAMGLLAGRMAAAEILAAGCPAAARPTPRWARLSPTSPAGPRRRPSSR
jgi:methylenetetrahydrofolate--tRNA-(uracil-5-)-methyltransferase